MEGKSRDRRLRLRLFGRLPFHHAGILWNAIAPRGHARGKCASANHGFDFIGVDRFRYLVTFWAVFAQLPLLKWVVNLFYFCPCPPANNLGSRVSSLVLRSRKYLNSSLLHSIHIYNYFSFSLTLLHLHPYSCCDDAFWCHLFTFGFSRVQRDSTPCFVGPSVRGLVKRSPLYLSGVFELTAPAQIPK